MTVVKHINAYIPLDILIFGRHSGISFNHDFYNTYTIFKENHQLNFYDTYTIFKENHQLNN